MLLHAVRRVPLAFWAFAIALLPVLVPAVHALLQFPFGSDAPVGSHDPDSWLRLTLVRDWLEGGGWYDHRYASNTPFEPIESPWTRPLDLVIAALAQLQWGELETRLVRSAILLPIIWMSLLTGALLFIVRRITPMPHALPMVGVLILTAPINYNYLGAANADHHAPLSALFCWVIALLLNHEPRRGNGLIAIGCLLALMLWISPEAMILIGVVYGWLGLQWLVGGSLRPLAKVATSTVFAAAVALAIERPPGEWLDFVYDRLSFAHLHVLAMVALACWLLTRITGFFWLWRALPAAILLGLVTAATWFLDPRFFLGPLAQVDAYIITDFLPRILEAKRAWSEPTLKVVGLMVQPALALYVAGRCAMRRNGVIAPAKSAALLYFLVVTLVLYFAQLRWAYYCFPLVPLLLAPYLAAWLNPQHRAVSPYWPASRLRRLSERALVVRRIPLLLVVLVLPLLLILTATLGAEKPTFKTYACHTDVRRMIQNGELARIGGGRALNLFAPTDLGAEILFFTQHRIIASNYHREGPGIKAIWDASMQTTLARFEQTLRRRKIDLVILCPDNFVPVDNAMHRLRDGRLKSKLLTTYRIKSAPLSKTPPAIFLVKPAAR